MMLRLSVYGETNVGRQRDHNEDAFAIFFTDQGTWYDLNDGQADPTHSDSVFLVIADGMGGANAGEVAS